MLRKLLILSVLLFTFIFASVAVAAEQIRIGIVVGQATAELSCEDEFTVRDSAGKTTTMPKGKYFIHAQQGKLFFDDNNVFGNEAVVAAAAGKKSPQINKRSYKGDFQLQAEQGDKLNLKSLLSQYVAIGALLGNHGTDCRWRIIWRAYCRPKRCPYGLMRLSRRRRLLPAATLYLKCSTAIRPMLCLRLTGSCLTEAQASALKRML